MKFLQLILVLSFAQNYECMQLIDDMKSLLSTPKWNTLRVTWGADPLRLSSNILWKVPLNTRQTAKKGFSKITESTACAGTFYGHRYAIGNDTSLVMLYDANGHVAGIQSGFPKDLITPAEDKWFKKSTVLIDDEINGIPTYTLTAYFVKPATICKNARSSEEVDGNPVGTQLYIQSKGNYPTFTKIPMRQSDTEDETEWTKGKCFVSMGVHFWYNVTKNMNCDNFKPIFLMYNRNMLTGFGWAVPSKFTFSKRFEHPFKAVFQLFLNPVPKCINDMYDKGHGFTSLHIFMNTDMTSQMC